MEEQITAGQAATLAHGTLSAQINTLISIASWQIKAQLESLSAILDTNVKMIVDASNWQIDEFNTLCDTLEARDKEIDQLKISLSRANADIRELEAYRKEDENKINAVIREHEKTRKLMEQITKQRDNFKQDADAASNVRAELRRIKNQLERNIESNTKNDGKMLRLEAKLTELKRKLTPFCDAVRQCLDLMRYTRNSMIFEGLSNEETLDIGGRVFYIYRRPCDIRKAFASSYADDEPSREHMYYFRVETHDGVHFDVMPMANGEIAITSLVKKVPAELKKHLKALFQKETLYDHERIQMRSDALTEALDSIEKTLPNLECLDEGLIKKPSANHYSKRKAA